MVAAGLEPHNLHCDTTPETAPAPLIKSIVQEWPSDYPEVDHVVLAGWIVGILRFPA